MERLQSLMRQARLDRSCSLLSRKIVETATRQLLESPYANVRRISCDYDQGLLFLRGRMPCFYHKQLAQETVREIEGVDRVVNEIEVVEMSS